jgi:hypothetical protein
MKQDTFIELWSQGLISSIAAQETMPSKGKSLGLNRTIWVLMLTLSNGNITPLISSRGTPREWASLDTLNDWLKNIGISNYSVSHMEADKR